MQDAVLPSEGVPLTPANRNPTPLFPVFQAGEPSPGLVSRELRSGRGNPDRASHLAAEPLVRWQSHKWSRLQPP